MNVEVPKVMKEEVVMPVEAQDDRESLSFEERPWGRFDVLIDDADRKVKRITVNPGQRLSLQSHTQRGEHWWVTEGEADVTLDDEVLRLGPGDHVFIPQGARHRAANPGESRLVFVELQVGTYFGEDDITRYQDDHGRA